MDIKTFEQLTTLDGRIAGLARLELTADGIRPVALSLDSLQDMIAQCDLIPEVPDHVRAHFETCRTLHTYGCFAYEFFTVVAQRVYLTLEAALGARFLGQYPRGVRLEHKKSGKTVLLHAVYYHELSEKLRSGWRLKTNPAFRDTMRHLLAWARQKRLLYGQRNRVVEGAIVQFRNMAAHPHLPSLVMPSDSVRAIRSVAEIINHLWGHDTPGGRLYGTPPAMALFAVKWSADGSRLACHAEHLPHIKEADRTGQWFLVELAEGDEWSWQPDFETTAYPSAMIGARRTWKGVCALWSKYQASGRKPRPREWRDRLFLVRYGANGIEPCRSRRQFRRLRLAERDLPHSRWMIVRADDPEAVFSYMQAILVFSFASHPQENRFSVQRIGDFATWQEAANRLTTL